MNTNKQIARRWIIGLGLLFILSSAFFAPLTTHPTPRRNNWKEEMDTYIKEHLQSCRMHVSYVSLDNLHDQYHRNANLPIPSSDVIKIPIAYEVLWEISTKEIRGDKKITVGSDQVQQNREGFLGREDLNKAYSIHDLMEAMLSFNDNAAANMLLDEVGDEAIVSHLREKDLPNIYLKKPLLDSLKNERNGRNNFVTSADMALLMRKIYSEKKLKQKDWLFDQLRQNASKNGDFGLNEGTVAGIGEKTTLSYGFVAVVEGEENYVLSIFITDFPTQNAASSHLHSLLSIFQSESLKGPLAQNK